MPNFGWNALASFEGLENRLQGGDMKLSVNFKLRNCLTNLNFAAKNWKNMHLNVFNNFL